MKNEIYKYKEDVEWSIPVLFDQEFVWTTIYNELININIRPPKVNVYGCPACLWTGGRIPLIQNVELRVLDRIFDYLESCNATPTFNFTYTRIEKDDLNDLYSNELLSFAIEHNSKFIVSSDLLRDYIKEKAPDAIVISSVIKAVKRFQTADKIVNSSPEEETNFYNKMLKKYDVVVVRPEYSRDVLVEHPEYIDDISRIEVLINQTCMPNCPHAIQHNERNEEHREGFNPSIPPFRCIKASTMNSVQAYKNNLIHTQKQISKLINNGVRHLKIQNRGALKTEPHQKLYLIYTQMFNTDGNPYMMLYNLDLRLPMEMQYFMTFAQR